VSDPSATREALDARYRLEEGTVLLTGIQALARLPLDQCRRDRRAGLRIAHFVSGYPGSPLGGYDLTLARLGPLLGQHDVVHVPALNEELAATAILGTQMLDHHPHPRFDGVVGVWYGKGPGLDRAGDALKHGNFAGTSRHGAVVVLCGEDHEAKSSTMPYQDDYALTSAAIPILYPASVSEFLTLGLHAVALSRFSGCWVALKLVNALCDGGETVSVSPASPSISVPELSIDGRPFQKIADFCFFPGKTTEIERRLHYERHRAVVAYARANRLDRVEASTPHDRLGIVAAGKSYADLRQALSEMGLDDEALRASRIRLLRTALVYPIEAELLREFARDLEEVVVIEEKRGFLETQVKAALAGRGHPLRVVGKSDERGEPLFPIQGGMDADLITERLGPRLVTRLADDRGVKRRLQALASVRARRYEPYSPRTPNYCSGCPHNTSTRLLEGQLAWGSPGCHSFASIIEQPERSIVAMTQYGGEGVPWIGLSHFTDRAHIVQNVGDGSLFHSSYLNIRFCVAAGANITFRILYNGAIANTGAQPAVGHKTVSELVRLLELEGVRRIAVVTKSPRAYRGVDLGSVARVYPRDRHSAAVRDLTRERGVTVLLYDDTCANERRRRERRGVVRPSNRFAVVHEGVCEGCGACGALTNCMSLQRVETEFGPKTRIHPSSCSQDFFCLEADCPSFVTVDTEEGTGLARPPLPRLGAADVPEPAAKPGCDPSFHIYVPGVGGTGVITVNAILAQAALLEAKHVSSYDQTGAAQKWGAVVSSLVVASRRDGGLPSKVGIGRADLYLALDLVGAAAAGNLDRCDPERTAAVVNTSVLPTGEATRNIDCRIPAEDMQNAILAATRSDRTAFVEAGKLSEALFGDHMMTNILALGIAYQSGLLPLQAASIERAIRMNGAQVEENLQAFRCGRLWVHDGARLRVLVEPPRTSAEEERGRSRARLDAGDLTAYDGLLERCSQLDDESRRMLAIRVADLVAYQDARYAERYVSFVLRVAACERARSQGRVEVTHAVIRNLHRLMAYKDEYEVARLYLAPEFDRQIRRLFTAPRRVRVHFRPPWLRALGLERKVALGGWIRPALRLLRSARGLRGTRWDPFGASAVRGEERRLIAWYTTLLEGALEELSEDTHGLVAEIAGVADRIRGYEDLKLENARRAREQARVLLARLKGAPRPPRTEARRAAPAPAS
jgi:indolepyruvate ferredoxin oxidoreductase